MRLMLAGAIACLGFGVAFAMPSIAATKHAGRAADAPPGATALCKDGTYSFSLTHSGTCSSHGGVAVWLDGSGGSTTTTPVTTSPATTSTTTDALAPHCQPTQGNPLLTYGPGLAIFYPFAYAYTGTLTTATIDYGDGSKANLPMPIPSALQLQHTYATNGTYTATLSCVDSSGRQASTSVSFAITTAKNTTPGAAPTTTTLTTTVASVPPKITTIPAHKVSSTPSSVGFGAGRAFGHRTRTSSCRLSSLPDRRCSPGAYYPSLTKTLLCSSSFHTSAIRHVTESEKHEVEREYGMAAKPYGSKVEIDHIVPLEIGGSNEITNLFPEAASAAPGYHVKDKLENRLHSAVCSGQMSLRNAQRQIAMNWERLYRQVFGVSPA
ncbi:MAG: DUF3761 domain-containing protein [Actinobacteria bacterium]|uniref:Unannotated protein n=1 Tax=freshwater metagenome TaxID=449393 RepID=A0A6J6P6L1_9ZZZZ|nr:DUF3761 domain-containing protein [Actinomycetota bacterium]